MNAKKPPVNLGNDYETNMVLTRKEWDHIVYNLRQIADADKCNFSADGVALAVRLARQLLHTLEVL